MLSVHEGQTANNQTGEAYAKGQPSGEACHVFNNNEAIDTDRVFGFNEVGVEECGWDPISAALVTSGVHHLPPHRSRGHDGSDDGTSNRQQDDGQRSPDAGQVNDARCSHHPMPLVVTKETDRCQESGDENEGLRCQSAVQAELEHPVTDDGSAVRRVT